MFFNTSGMSKKHGILELNKNAAYLPFGSGSRACIGQKFSILGIASLFASLLQNYEVGDMIISIIFSL